LGGHDDRGVNLVVFQRRPHHRPEVGCCVAGAFGCGEAAPDAVLVVCSEGEGKAFLDVVVTVVGRIVGPLDLFVVSSWVFAA